MMEKYIGNAQETWLGEVWSSQTIVKLEEVTEMKRGTAEDFKSEIDNFEMEG